MLAFVFRWLLGICRLCMYFLRSVHYVTITIPSLLYPSYRSTLCSWPSQVAKPCTVSSLADWPNMSSL